MNTLRKKNFTGNTGGNLLPMDEAKTTFSRIGFFLTVMLLVIQGIETGFYFIMEKAAPKLTNEPWMSWLMVVIGFYLTAFPLYCILMKKIPDAPREEPKSMSILKLIGFFIIGMAVLYLFNLLSMVLNSVAGIIKEGVMDNPLNTVVNSSNVYYNILFVGIIAPIIEEIMFRGILLNKLRCYGDRVAIGFTALVFGFFHLNSIQVIYAAALGILFAYVAVRTNRILYSVLLHMGINLVAMVAAPALSSAGHLRLVGLLIYFFVIFGFILFMIMKRRFYLEEGSKPIDKKAVKTTVYFNKGMLLYFGTCILIMSVMIILKN